MDCPWLEVDSDALDEDTLDDVQWTLQCDDDDDFRRVYSEHRGADGGQWRLAVTALTIGGRTTRI